MAELKHDDEMVYELADLFRMFADSTRVKIMSALMDTEVGVTELANGLQMTTSAVSHQLRILKDSRLIRSRRDGKGILYSLAESECLRSQIQRRPAPKAEALWKHPKKKDKRS